MEHHNNNQVPSNGHYYGTRQYEGQNNLMNEMAKPMGYPWGMFAGCGATNYQTSTENNYKSFSAQNFNTVQKEESPEYYKQDDEFERSERSMMNKDFYREEKTYNMSQQNLDLMNDDRAPSMISMNDNKSSFPAASLMSLAKPISPMNDAHEITTDIYRKAMVVKIKDIERGEYKTELIVKIQRKTDPNLQKTKLHLELTEESRPLFLYTCDITEGEFQSIRKHQQIRVEFHQLAEYLEEVLDRCISTSNGQCPSSPHYCFMTPSTLNDSTFLVQEQRKFKDISLIELKFEAASSEKKLNFLSKQVSDFKNYNAQLIQERDSKIRELDNVKNEYQSMEKSYTKTNNESESVKLKVDQLAKIAEEQDMRLQSNSKELQQLKSDLETTTKQRNELQHQNGEMKTLLSESKMDFESENRELKRKLELLERDNASYKSELDKISGETKQLRYLMLDNEQNLTKYKLKNESLTNELNDKISSIADKSKLTESQATYIKQLETEIKQCRAKFAKMESKLSQCAKEINKGNDVIEKLRTEKGKFREKYKEYSTKYNEYYEKAEPELKDLRAKAKLCEEQKATIDYLQKKLTEEQKLNNKSGLLMNNTSKFQPSFNPSSFAGRPSNVSSTYEGASRAPNIPKSTTFTSSYKPPSYSSSERGVSAGVDRYSYQNPSFTPTQNSPYSRYSENKTLNGTPSASSLHSINISGVSGQNSVHSSYQVHCPSNNTASFKKEMEIESSKMNKENKSPNALTMSLVHTTKPAENKQPTQEFEKTDGRNMFDRKLSEDDEWNQSNDSDSDDSDINDKSQDGIIPIKYIQESQ